MSSINRNPVRDTLDARDFDWLIEQYLNDCSQRLETYTVACYRRTLFYFIEWWSDVGPQQEYMLCQDDMSKFSAYLEERKKFRHPGIKLSWHTRNNALRRLTTLFHWAYQHGYIDRDYGHWVPAAAGQLPEREPISVDVVEKLFAAAGQTSKPIRNKAIVAAFVGTGIRRAEAAGIMIPDVKIDEDGKGSIAIRARVKNGNTRCVAVDPTVGRYIYDYIEWLYRWEGPLFPGHDASKPLTPTGIYKVMKICCKIAELDLERPCHDLRMLFASDWSRKHKGVGYDLLLLRQLGHRRYHTTADHYIKTDVSDIQEAMTSPPSA